MNYHLQLLCMPMCYCSEWKRLCGIAMELLSHLSKQLELCTWWWTSKEILIMFRSGFLGIPQSPPTQWSSTTKDFFHHSVRWKQHIHVWSSLSSQLYVVWLICVPDRFLYLENTIIHLTLIIHLFYDVIALLIVVAPGLVLWSHWTYWLPMQATLPISNKSAAFLISFFNVLEHHNIGHKDLDWLMPHISKRITPFFDLEVKVWFCWKIYFILMSTPLQVTCC